MDIRDFSITVSAIGKMAPLMGQAEEKCILSPVYSFLNSYPHWSSNIADVRYLLFGLASLKAKWSVVNDGHRKLESTIIDMLKNENFNQVLLGDVVWSMGTMRAVWTEISSDLRETIMDNFDGLIGQMSAYSLSSNVWSLVKMGVTWSDFSPSSRTGLVQKLEAMTCMIASDATMREGSSNKKKIRQFTPSQAAKLVWAIGRLDTSSSSTRFPLYIMEALLLQAGGTKKSKMGAAVNENQALIGLAKSGVTWEYLSPKAKTGLLDQFQRVCQSSNDQALVSSVWAMGSLESSRDELGEEVQGDMFRSIQRLLATSKLLSWGLSNVSSLHLCFIY